MSMEDDGKVLHLVMFPWLAIGHLRPFFELSKRLARKGHRVSYVSTPRNLQTLPKIPPDLANAIKLVSLPFPSVPNLPEHAESSMDIPHTKQQLLKIAFDMLQQPLASFLENTTPKPDWIFCDYASHWLPRLAAENGILTAYFSLFMAAMMAFLGPPSELLSGGGRLRDRDFTVVPEWIPSRSNLAYRPHEMISNMENAAGNESGVSDMVRFAMTIAGSNAVVFRTCVEFEPEWFDLVCRLFDKKPVIPVGALPPILEDGDEGDDSLGWATIRDWLDKQTAVDSSLVYVALGTEATLNEKQIHELAIGLEKCGLPFLWVLRKPQNKARSGQTCSSDYVTLNNDPVDMLPEGFQDRVKDRGKVYTQWVPQVKILSHPALGGFLTHCGCNSVIEGLSFGRVLILLPLVNDQGINARLLEEKKVGLEIPRNETDGMFRSDDVAETLRQAVNGEEGKTVRDNARRVGKMFADEGKNGFYIDSLVDYLVETRGRSEFRESVLS